ncbi:L1 [Fulmarus glacialis papillomavirus 1]|uniref:Major capsid protein L1 n=1 Tax=Fulmarus glacialis papillomavirus 1 TaxID=1463817 RepID=A0A059TB36_9PAPI|nr:L1 [Fulmarus glacialis papillomavirus 1]AHV82120.1 L1 [Fulmarus glacialis papillomavirus 1]
MSLNVLNGQPFFLSSPQSSSTPLLNSTDEFVQDTDIVLHASSDKLFLVGHPYYSQGVDPSVDVPMCSAYQYRVFKIVFPDPHKLALIPSDIYDPSKQRLAYKLVGLEVTRDAPLGVGLSGAPNFNALDATVPVGGSKDHRGSFAFDCKQSQLMIVGCVPVIAQHWDRAKLCKDAALEDRKCPPIELVNTVLQDGDLCDMGFGILNFKTLDEDGFSLPLELRGKISKYPDFVKMQTSGYGNSCFWFLKREQMFAKNTLFQPGTYPEAVPSDLANSAFFTTTSGSLVSSDTQLFNKPYWLSHAQGGNNGMLWGNTCFVTLLDTTRNTIFNVNIRKSGANSTYDETETYRFLRHTEQFTFQLIVRVCVVPLTAQTLTFLNTSAPYVLPQWGITNEPPVQSSPEDIYRYITSKATRCPPAEEVVPAEVDPFSKVKTWDILLEGHMSLDLHLTSLGRRYLAYMPRTTPRRTTVKRRKATSSSDARKRRRPA